jgi:hypothetical protein
MAAFANPVMPAAAGAAPIAIDHAKAWLQPSARIAWQRAIIRDPDLPAGAMRMA